MTQEQLDKVQKVWNKANQIISLSHTIGMDSSERMDGISVGDMELLMQYVVALIKKKDELELTLEGVMWSVDKWLDGDELNQDPVNRAITMREKILKLLGE